MSSSGGFLHGRFISSFDPYKEELPERGTLQRQLFTHDITQVNICDLKENRYSISNFFDKDRQKLYKKIYCWKGIIRQNRGVECTVGTVCSPYSYADARTRFCLTWNCPDPHLFVADDKGEPVKNERGGIVVYTRTDECGPLLDKLGCFIGGIRQSLDHILDPSNRKQLFIQMGILAVVFIVFAIVAGRLRRSKNRRIVGLRKAITPSFVRERRRLR